MSRKPVPDPEQVLDAALALAADRHWEAVRLYEVAARLETDLGRIRACVPDKEALVDVIWDRADAAMLADAGTRADGFLALDFAGRFEYCLMAWLVPLRPHRRTVAEMLQVRMEPGHFHIQIPTLIRVSHTVQWMRELCRRDATFLRRAAEETALTTVFVSTVATWLRDESPDEHVTREALARRFARAASLGRLWPEAGAPDPGPRDQSSRDGRYHENRTHKNRTHENRSRNH